MKKLFFVLALLWASPALAQTCPTRPVGDNSNACASTAFVHNGYTPIPGNYTANLPLIGNGTPTPVQGTRSGNTTEFVTTTGAQTNGRCVTIDANGNHVPATGPCQTTTISNVSASNQNTTANCIASNTTIALASAIDFVNGQGIGLEHCGTTFSGAAPTGLAVSSTGVTFQGPAGTTTYYYDIACVDDNGGVGAAVAEVHITNGAATLGVVVQSATPTLSWNTVSWTTSCPAVAVWRSIGNNTTYHLIGVFTNAGLGTLIYDSGFPQVTIPWIPDTPTGSALNDRLVTTISSGAGTTSLVVASAPANSAPSAYTRHDDTAALNTYLSANTAASLPAGTFNVEALTIPTTVGDVGGAGAGATTVQGWNIAEPAVYATGMPNGFGFHDMSVVTEAMGTPAAVDIASTNHCKIYNLNLSAAVGLEMPSDLACEEFNANIVVWYNIGISESSGNGNGISNNYLAPSREIPLGDGIIISGSDTDIIQGNRLNGTFFGILLQSGTNGDIVQGNQVFNSWREGYHISGNGSNNTIRGNTMNGGLISVDYCLSMSDDTVAGTQQLANVVMGNYFEDCGNSAIAIGFATSSSSGTFNFSTITGNVFVSPNINGYAGAGVISLLGGTLSETRINGNTLYNTASTQSAYVVIESTISGHTPDHTQVGTMFGDSGSTGKTSLIGTGSTALTGGSTGL